MSGAVDSLQGQEVPPKRSSQMTHNSSKQGNQSSRSERNKSELITITDDSPSKKAADLSHVDRH